MRYKIETKDLLFENIQLIIHLFESSKSKSKSQLLAIIARVNGWSIKNGKCYYYYNAIIKERLYDEQLNQFIYKI